MTMETFNILKRVYFKWHIFLSLKIVETLLDAAPFPAAFTHQIQQRHHKGIRSLRLSSTDH